MKTSYAAILAITLSTLATGYASAADGTAIGKTRDQVRAELADAQRTGDIYANDNSGKKLNELRPDLYPAKVVGQGKTRDQVRAELADAQRTGDILAFGDSGQKLNELYPSQYPTKAAEQGKTREQVLAELVQAQHSGEYKLNENHGG